MFLRSIVLALTATAIVSGDAPPPDHDSAPRQDLAAAIDNYFARISSYGFSGAVLLATEGEIVLRRGYGLADRRSGRPVTPTTR